MASKHLTQLSIQLYQPEIIIQPHVGHISVLQKIDTDEIIQTGIDATETAIQAIKSEANWIKKIQRKVKHRIMPTSLPEYWENIED